MGLQETPEPKRPSRSANLTYTGIAGFAGCLITALVIGALLLGMWIDSLFGRRPGLFTVGLVVLSVPVTLFVAFRLVLALVKRIQPPPTDKQHMDSSTEEG
jgi:hypothetical protein